MNIDDPRLTAYALDELDGRDRAEVEEFLAGNPDAAVELEATAAFADRLRLDFHAASIEMLTGEQRTLITGNVPIRTPVPFVVPRMVRWALAASIVLGVGWALVIPVVTGLGWGRIAATPKDAAGMQDDAHLDRAGNPDVRVRVVRPALQEENVPPQEGALKVPALALLPPRIATPDSVSAGARVSSSQTSYAIGDAGLQEEDRSPASGESYGEFQDNPFRRVADAPLSTFSADVDTASYANARRFLNNNALPPKEAVRIEEMVNYFPYDYAPPQDDAPFSTAIEAATCPWNAEHRLIRVGLSGRVIARAERPESNLVFLIDVSGSMAPDNKLPLLKRSLALMVEQLNRRDRVGIVVYAGAAGCVLEPTSDKAKILAALDRLESGGNTAGADGIEMAYRLAEKHFIRGGTNRVVLATDGDWNVGVTEPAELWRMIERKARGGVSLTVLGFGMQNLKDHMLEQLADKGNGTYAYIDTPNEARKVLVRELGAALVTIAKDVKLQVKFNPEQVEAYRLIGYENRALAAKDFADDQKDAGDIGAGHRVTAFYEVIPATKNSAAIGTFRHKPAQAPRRRTAGDAAPAETLTVSIRFKKPDGLTSAKLDFPFTDDGRSWDQASTDFRFAASVAGYGMLLRDSPHKGSATWEMVRRLATDARGEDRDGYRVEFIGLVAKAGVLAR